jgi:hypothetical protein
MKNAVFFLITICIMCLGACKKDANKKKTNNSVPADGWTLGTTQFTEAVGARTITNSGGHSYTVIVAFDAPPSGSNPTTNTFQAVFATAPGANGTYHVVLFPGPTVLAADEVGIVAAGPDASYTSTGTGPVDATVTVTGGKVKVVVPAVQVKKTTSSDVLNVTGTITEM